MLLYFISQPRLNRTQAEGLLPGRFAGGFAARQVTSGPSSKPGTVFCSDDRFCRFDAESQEWHSAGMFPGKSEGPEAELAEDPHANLVEVWIGWDKNQIPTAESLERPEMLRGHQIELAGQQWVIPLIREYRLTQSENVVYQIALPKAARYAPETKTWHAGEVEIKYQRLFDIGQEIFDAYTGQDSDSGEFSLPDNAMDLCAELLAVNYRLGPEEISALKLVRFDFDCVWSILRLAIDEPGMIEMHQKKMASGGS